MVLSFFLFSRKRRKTTFLYIKRIKAKFYNVGVQYLFIRIQDCKMCVIQNFAATKMVYIGASAALGRKIEKRSFTEKKKKRLRKV